MTLTGDSLYPAVWGPVENLPTIRQRRTAGMQDRFSAIFEL